MNCHPLLKGKGGTKREKGYSHGLSSNQMHEMAAICDALLPSLPLDTLNNKDTPQDHTLLAFYKASGSQAPFPDEVIFFYPICYHIIKIISLLIL